ncbi:hypothetical protein [Streptomyces sp. NPDC014746]|uniref:hypothetical protein n=1 Tax=Streptomyces sp. NPDC014746 TaxID=3364904 RepID=UPI003701D7C7
MLVLLVVLVVLVLVGVRHLGDVRRVSVTYAATAAGFAVLLVLVVVQEPQHLHAARGAVGERGGDRSGPAAAGPRRPLAVGLDPVEKLWTARGPRTVGGMTKFDTPRDAGGAKLCAWCGGAIRQSGVGRSRDYCQRLCRDQAYKKRRDQRLIDDALAAVRHVSPSAETQGPVSPDGETRSEQVPAPAEPSGDFLLAPPAAPRRPLSRRRSGMQTAAMPLLPFDADGE